MLTETNEDTEMNSSKINVKIGRKYEDAFKSICDLVNSGCIDRSIVMSCKEDRYIETAQYIFEYTGDVATIDTGSELGMMPSGASWFMGFRGGESDTVMGTWHNLLELVATNYHKEYSLVEYVQNTCTVNAEETRAHKAVISRVMEGLNYPVTNICSASQEDSVEDVYALSIRIELFSGAGEPKPLLCKLYFRKRNGVFTPVETEDARAIDDYICSIVSKRNTADQATNTFTETEIVDNVLNAVSKLISGEMPIGFADSMLITNDTDKETFIEFLDNEPRDEVRLECKKIKVLGISHVQWIDPAFYVYVNNKKAFLAKVDVNESLSLFCCCNAPNNKLIDNNVIVCKSEESGAVTKIRLDTSKENLGLTTEQFEMIQRESEFADHFFPINCSEPLRRGIDCLRYRCKSNTLAFEVNGKMRYKCNDCPYPEVLSLDADGKPAYTPLLNFDTSTLQVVHAETEACRFCGRTYTAEGLNRSFYCKFCASAIEAATLGDASKIHKKKYRLYSNMLPLSLRALRVFDKKYCFENEDRLIFIVGKKKFFFDKLELNDSGMIKPPVERK